MLYFITTSFYVKQGFFSRRYSLAQSNSAKQCNIICTVFSRLTNHQLAILWEVIFRNFQVQRGRASPYAAGDIVVRTVARTEPAAVVTCLTNGDTTQMCADTQHNEPLRLLDSVGIGLGVSEGFDPVYGIST